jgi:L-aminoadipate-semialdehyde dehydrogenase
LKGDDLSELLSSTEDEEDEETPYDYKYRRLIKSIKDYLKTKLPNYSVPTGKF